MTQGLANELKEKKIRVNCVVPGVVITELWDKMGRSKEQQKELFDNTAKDLPVGFVATPEDVSRSLLSILDLLRSRLTHYRRLRRLICIA